MNKEVKIAIVVGVLMITICLMAIIISQNSIKAEDVNLVIYKLNKTGDSTADYTYEKCSVSTEELLPVYKVYKKMLELSDDKKVTGEQIMGEYMLRDENNYVAFDDDDTDYIYLSKTSSLYEYKTNIYQTIVELCSTD